MNNKKTTIAKLLATENITIEWNKVNTASFDVKHRILTLPIYEGMNDNIQELMQLHEVGHALYTPLDMLETAKDKNLNKGIINVIEDVRIEKAIQKKYPGAVKCFEKGYEDLIEQDFFGIKNKNVSKLHLMDRVNLHFKHIKDVPFTEDEMKIVKMVDDCKTPEDVLQAAEIIGALENEKKKEEDDAQKMAAATQDQDGEIDADNQETQPETNSQEEESDATEAGNVGEEEETEEKVEENAETGRGQNTEDAKDENKEENEIGDVEGKNDTLPTNNDSFESETQNQLDKHIESKVDITATKRLYMNVPKINLDNLIIKYDRVLKECDKHYNKTDHQGSFKQNTLEEIKTIKEENKKVVAYMAKEFEMKKAADQYARAQTSKTGTLDLNKLHTYKYNDDLFAKVTTLPGATNHAMIIHIDWSGSMAYNLSSTMKQLFNLIWFCKRVNIPFEVYAFTSGYYRKHHMYDVEDAPAITNWVWGDANIDGLNLINFFSSKMKNAELDKMMHYVWMITQRYGYRDWRSRGYPIELPRQYSLDATPLDHTILASLDLIDAYKKQTKVQKMNLIFLTDGASHDINGKNVTTKRSDGGIEKDIQQGYGRTTYLKDKVSGKTVVYGRETRRESTIAYLNLLKMRHPDVNVVGFFLAGNKRGVVPKHDIIDKLRLRYTDADYEQVLAAAKKALSKDKVLVVKSQGYDEYYILPTNSEEVEGDLDIQEGASVAVMKRAFMKSTSAKRLNRQLLNKFIKMVA
ncbi:MAG: hypothetical protein CMG00_00075 [Candidatus Marinimicrobia bacterium]|nr:hypothetical protein [Candidatus Neomarinimicrobiota bacterium]|tara:strand:- start:566 stop:2812 length:2247 start_codon:yes stop_codon:yes gene_type:complete